MRGKLRPFLLPLAVYLGVLIAPYWLAWQAAGTHFVFGGVLFNPQDGFSYLAKMREGWSGAWRFTLPYTAHPGPGAYLFLFYLALGHVARWLHAPLVVVYHGARLLGALALAWALWRFFEAVLRPRETARRAWQYALFALGMGWLALFWGYATADLWVAEAYPILSALTNAHFPWALALLIFLLTPEPRGLGWLGAAALALAMLSPFGVVVALTVWGVYLGWAFTVDEARQKRLAGRRLLAIALGGLPYVGYAYWATLHDPVLAAWNAQNVTPMPKWWDVLLSFSPWLEVGLGGLFLGALRIAKEARAGAGGSRLIQQAAEAGRQPGASVARRGLPVSLWSLTFWAVVALGLAVFPWALQRRFLMGLVVPLVGLTVWALAARGWPRWASLALWALTVPTLAAVLLLAWRGIATHDSHFYLTRGEAAAMQWLAEHTPPDAVVLAAPETGMFIPALSGRRVLYGHPMETIEAPRYRELTGDFFRRCFKGAQAWAFLQREGVNYIFLGPRERALGGLPLYLPPDAVVARFDGVTIYRVPEP